MVNEEEVQSLGVSSELSDHTLGGVCVGSMVPQFVDFWPGIGRVQVFEMLTGVLLVTVSQVCIISDCYCAASPGILKTTSTYTGDSVASCWQIHVR